jgi:hypothetical protein
MSVCVCVRVALHALCMSAIDSLQTHIHTSMRSRTLTHTDDDGKRGTSRRWVEERKRERRSPPILAHKMIVMLFARWRRPVEWHFYAVTERWFFSSSSTSSILYCPVWLSFFLSIHNNYYNSYRFLCYHMNVYVCMHLQRPWKCAMLHCNRWSIGRSSVCVCEFTKGTK